MLLTRFYSIRVEKKINEPLSLSFRVDYSACCSVVNDCDCSKQCVSTSHSREGGRAVLAPDEAELKENIILRVPPLLLIILLLTGGFHCIS